MKKIAIITSFPRAERVHVYNIMAKNNEFEFRVFYLRSMPYGRHWTYGPTLEHDHILVKEGRLWKHLYLSPNLLKLFKEYAPDLMLMTQYASLGMQMLMYYCSYKKIPWVFWAEAPYVRYEVPFIENTTVRTLLRKTAMLPIKYWAREVWGVGNRAVEEYRDEFGVRKKYKNLPYYSNLDRFFDLDVKPRADNSLTFLFSGSLSYRKGADLFADAIEELAQKKLCFNVIIMGVGEYAYRFKEMESYENIKIKNLGFVQLNTIADYYSLSDVLVYPTRYDGWGMTLPEGMASGLAVITTNEAGCSIDTINDGVNGVLVDTSNYKFLCDAMLHLIKEPNCLLSLGVQARKTIKKYTHEEGAIQFSKFLNIALDSYIIKK